MSLADLLRARIVDVPDFPTEGVVLKDISPVLADHEAFSAAVDAVVAHHLDHGVDKVVGIEARGFILAAPAAYRLGAGFVPVSRLRPTALSGRRAHVHPGKPLPAVARRRPGTSARRATPR